MNKYKITRLIDEPQMKTKLAKWFSEKWGVSEAAYAQSMEDSFSNSSVPQWYCVLDEGKIIGGLGVIENDFHDRTDLSPNICAVYVEEEYRCKGIAGKMLSFVCHDMKNRGINKLYLVTDHVGFYEKYGWQFLCMVQGDGEENLTRMYVNVGEQGLTVRERLGCAN